MMIITEPGESGVLIEEIREEDELENATRLLIQSLLNTKLFKNFFNQLDFQDEAWKEVTEKLVTVAQNMGQHATW